MPHLSGQPAFGLDGPLLAGLIRQAGVLRNQDLATAYLQNRIFKPKLENEETAATVIGMEFLSSADITKAKSPRAVLPAPCSLR